MRLKLINTDEFPEDEPMTLGNIYEGNKFTYGGPYEEQFFETYNDEGDLTMYDLWRFIGEINPLIKIL